MMLWMAHDVHAEIENWYYNENTKGKLCGQIKGQIGEQGIGTAEIKKKEYVGVENETEMLNGSLSKIVCVGRAITK